MSVSEDRYYSKLHVYTRTWITPRTTREWILCARFWANRKGMDDARYGECVQNAEDIAKTTNDWHLCLEGYNELSDLQSQVRCRENMEARAESTLDWEACHNQWRMVGIEEGAKRCRESYFREEIKRNEPMMPLEDVEAIGSNAMKRPFDATPLNDFIRHQIIAHIRHKYTNYDERLRRGENREQLRKRINRYIITEGAKLYTKTNNSSSERGS